MIFQQRDIDLIRITFNVFDIVFCITQTILTKSSKHDIYIYIYIYIYISENCYNYISYPHPQFSHLKTSFKPIKKLRIKNRQAENELMNLIPVFRRNMIIYMVIKNMHCYM